MVNLQGKTCSTQQICGQIIQVSNLIFGSSLGTHSVYNNIINARFSGAKESKISEQE